ncbi:carbohydrate kinase family protein [Agromyces aurantiacus]|uniref:Carbohydrate kinase family protein n=1 Tax=Agromyces aurantiacus TaxID=165814 RepID=A0ABV9R7M9_9MICO|nr:PfkB family carbohydrate kinase [Agromyces aurantiacus]MBM7503032.1 fructokinase [Agromyces aurantiacus]
MPQPSDSPARITVVGDALIDELRDPTGSREFVGGAALNVAVGLALLGEDATLVAMLGDDEPAERIRAFLDDYRVRLVASPSEHGTSRAVSIRTDGEPRYEFNEAAQRRRLRFDDATRAALDEADLVVVSCYPFDDDEQVDLLLDAIRDPERRLVVDGNPRSGMLHDRDRFLVSFERVAARSLLVKVGDEDAELLLGAPLEEFVRRLRSGDAASGPAVLATAGRRGAALHHAGIDVRADIVELPGPVVDTMGAGDATLSAIVHHIAVHGVPTSAPEWSEALGEAMTIAAATVRHEGALLRTGIVPPRVGS